jgi:hypothetical protein
MRLIFHEVMYLSRTYGDYRPSSSQSQHKYANHIIQLVNPEKLNLDLVLDIILLANEVGAHTINR